VGDAMFKGMIEVRYNRLLTCFSKKEDQIRLIKFFCIGGFNYLLNIVMVWVGTEIMGFYYLVSVAVAYLIITIANFFWHSGFIFKVQRSSAMFFKYIGILALFYFMHIGFVMALTDWLRLYYLLSVIISVSTLFFVKFLIYNTFVFKDA